MNLLIFLISICVGILIIILIGFWIVWASRVYTDFFSS